MPGQVDKEQVKRRLRLEQQAWEAEQLAAGCSEAPTLQFWSVGKLLRVLQASRSAENALEMLAQCGIVRHLVGSVDPRRATSQPTAESPQTAPKADAVTYTSSRVWLTGFLHFGEDVDACDTLHLCDNNAKLPSFLLDPSPQLVDQLVLVKRWVLVDKAFGGVRTAGSMFLEVHDEKPVSLMPVEGDFVDWPREKVMESQGSVEDDDEEQPIVMTVDPGLHKAHLISIIGKIATKKYFWQASSTQQSSNGTVGTKRAREVDNEEGAACGSSQRLLCILHVRDLQHLDTVEIRVDASRFGLLATLQVNRIIEFTRLQGFIARSSYKVYLKWSHLTAARPIPDDARLPIPSDAMLYGSMTTTFLNDLYHSSYVDRRLHRYVVGVMHISYVLMRRKCGSCHQALQLIKRRGCWKHAEPQPGVAFYRECKWRQQHWAISDPAFKTRTYLGTTVRCVIDDGSAQAELFLENDVAWELLTCPAGQRRRFEDILSHYVDDLSYFSGRTATGSIATSRAEREREYYQNELRAFVVGAIPALRSVAVFARRFYKAQQQREGTSVLTFGKDIHLTTQTAPQPKLEARRVDRLHVRSELRRRLAQLRRSGPD
ncbi:uncharacterized protein IUM83_10073 [Phytophthora cinnamomi]|uniref:uncharacterized protein n=1 Tax=Phytophthora cinnamomi TaxID=4785 RepID=UPI003559F964|nr:hypothetical protein IUM83_10073 [Phytophthora cinnamomi]